MWAEPGETGLLIAPRRSRINTPEHGWFSDRPRPVLLGIGAVIVAFGLGFVAVGKPTLAVAALIGMGLVVAVLIRPVVGGLVLVGMVPILSGLGPGVPVAHVRASEVLVGVVGVTVLASARRSDAVPWTSLDWLLLAYGLGWAFFGAIDAVTLHQSMSITDWGTAIGQLQFFLIYRGVRTALRTHAERKMALAVLLAASVPVALLAVLQQLHVGPIVSFLNKATGGLAVAATAKAGAATRATGPFDNWAALAGYLLPLVFVLVALTMSGQVAKHRRAAWVVGVCALTGILLTAEISAITFLCIGVVILARQYGHGRRALRYAGTAFVIGGLIAAPFLASRLNQEFSSSAGSTRHAGVPQTIDFRWYVWSTQYIPAIGDRPLSGYGEHLPDSIHWPYPESQYVTYLMEGGFPVLLIFAALAWAMAKRSREAARSEDPFEQALGRAAVVAVFSMLAMNLIWPFLSNGGMPQVLWCLLAIAVPRPNKRGAIPSTVGATTAAFVPAGGVG